MLKQKFNDVDAILLGLCENRSDMLKKKIMDIYENKDQIGNFDSMQNVSKFFIPPVIFNENEYCVVISVMQCLSTLISEIIDWSENFGLFVELLRMFQGGFYRPNETKTIVENFVSTTECPITKMNWCGEVMLAACKQLQREGISINVYHENLEEPPRYLISFKPIDGLVERCSVNYFKNHVIVSFMTCGKLISIDSVKGSPYVHTNYEKIIYAYKLY